MPKSKKKGSLDSDENLSLKYSMVELPSNGLLGYDELLEYRDILVRDEKILASATDKTFNTILNKVLKSLLKDKDSFDQLTIYDRDYLLIWIWANCYSPEKTVQFQCPHCDAENDYQIDLTKMKVKDLDPKYKVDYPLELSSGEKIKLNLITVKDEEIAKRYAAVSKNNIDEIITILCQSVKFDVVTSLRDKIKKIDDFTGKDMAIIRGFHSYFKYGFDDVVEKECPSCLEVSAFSVPFKIEWFLPTISDNFKPTV